MLYDPKWEEKIEVPGTEPWREILRQAAEIIKERGWCQGKLSDEQDRVCMFGAVINASGCVSTGEPLTNAVLKLSREVGHIPDYNDARGRTEEQVVATLLKVANS